MSKQQSQLFIEWGGGVLDFILRSEKQQWKGNGEICKTDHGYWLGARRKVVI